MDEEEINDYEAPGVAEDDGYFVAPSDSRAPLTPSTEAGHHYGPPSPYVIPLATGTAADFLCLTILFSVMTLTVCFVGREYVIGVGEKMQFQIWWYLRRWFPKLVPPVAEGLVKRVAPKEDSRQPHQDNQTNSPPNQQELHED